MKGTLKVSGIGLVSKLVASGDRVFAADASGAVFAFGGGRVLWSARIGNSENGNSSPVLAPDGVVFAGDKKLAFLEAASGKQRFSLDLDAASSGLFGRRPAVAGDRLYLATGVGIRIVDLASGADAGSIATADGIDTTPLVSGPNLYAVSSNGILYVMDRERRSVSQRIKTPISQPIAVQPVLAGGAAFLVDRKGLVVRVDLQSGAVAWQKRLDPAKALNVFQDPLVLGDGLYLFAKSTIYGLSCATGERLFAPIPEASSPPSAKGGALWFGTQDGRIVAVDPATGKTLWSQKAADKIVGVAGEAEGLLAFPTEAGTALLVDAAAALRAGGR
jgi:outer membrane protein assembly factor BamB